MSGVKATTTAHLASIAPTWVVPTLGAWGSPARLVQTERLGLKVRWAQTDLQDGTDPQALTASTERLAVLARLVPRVRGATSANPARPAK